MFSISGNNRNDKCAKAPNNLTHKYLAGKETSPPVKKLYTVVKKIDRRLPYLLSIAAFTKATKIG